MATAINTETSSLSLGLKTWKVFRPFVIGGIAGCTSMTIIMPVDTIKVRIQLMGEGGTAVGNYKVIERNPFKVGYNMIRYEGFQSLYRGLSAQYARQITYGTARLGIFRTLTNYLQPIDGKPSDIHFFKRVLCSITAGGLGALIGTPCEAALIRMQSDGLLPLEQRRNYKNVFDAILRMLKEEGWQKGFFAGASPTITRAVVINVGILSSYDPIYGYLTPYLGETQKNRFFSGFMSGLCAATITLPFDFIKTRMQKQIKNIDGTYPYSNVYDCIKQVTKNEGITTFYNGYGTFILRIAPIVMFQWVIMDNLKLFFEKRGL